MNRLLEIITSNRLGDGSYIFKILSDVFSESPFIGYGFGQVNLLSLDNGYLHVLVLGGLASLILFILLLFYILFITLLKYKKKIFYSLLLIWIVLILSTLGSEIVVANRLSIIIWVLTAVALLENNRGLLKIK